MTFAPKRAILHCAATPDHKPGEKGYDQFGAKEIDSWHRQRGFAGIGYHYVIRQSGVIELGRDLSGMGAHCEGENHDSIGVCYVGTRRMLLLQVESLIRIADELWDKFSIRAEDWYGHHEFNPGKECPGVPMDLVRVLLHRAV